MPVAAFLRLPGRSRKPRRSGLTCVIDGGLPVTDVRALLESAAASVDVWKLGWGSAYLDAALDSKLALLRRHDVVACPGGTLLEVASYQGRTEECLNWMAAIGFEQIEVSDGLGLLGEQAKAALIRRAAASFTVVSEVGLKRAGSVMPAAMWVKLARADLESGAAAVIVEGRESGTVGMYAEDGSARADVVDALLDGVGVARLVFEAPRKDQQAWLVRHVGTDVNVGNVAPRDVLGLEALRLGLRADTMIEVHARAALPR
jgi:phosphosulfolactate synthase